MDEIYLDVTVSADCKSAFISDWTEFMHDTYIDNIPCHIRYKREFVEIKGNYLTIYVRGFGDNYGRCKSFAIWYICNREIVSTHRLDFVYGISHEGKKRRQWFSLD